METDDDEELQDEVDEDSDGKKERLRKEMEADPNKPLPKIDVEEAKRVI